MVSAPPARGSGWASQPVGVLFDGVDAGLDVEGVGCGVVPGPIARSMLLISFSFFAIKRMVLGIRFFPECLDR